MLADLAGHDEGASGGLSCRAVAALHVDSQPSNQGERRLGEALLSETPDTSSHLLQERSLIYQGIVGKFAAAAVTLLVKHLCTEQTAVESLSGLDTITKITDNVTCACQGHRRHYNALRKTT